MFGSHPCACLCLHTSVILLYIFLSFHQFPSPILLSPKTHTRTLSVSFFPSFLQVLKIHCLVLTLLPVKGMKTRSGEFRIKSKFTRRERSWLGGWLTFVDVKRYSRLSSNSFIFFLLAVTSSISVTRSVSSSWRWKQHGINNAMPGPSPKRFIPCCKRNSFSFQLLKIKAAAAYKCYA